MFWGLNELFQVRCLGEYLAKSMCSVQVGFVTVITNKSSACWWPGVGRHVTQVLFYQEITGIFRKKRFPLTLVNRAGKTWLTGQWLPWAGRLERGDVEGTRMLSTSLLFFNNSRKKSNLLLKCESLTNPTLTSTQSGMKRNYCGEHLS